MITPIHKSFFLKRLIQSQLLIFVVISGVLCKGCKKEDKKPSEPPTLPELTTREVSFYIDGSWNMPVLSSGGTIINDGGSSITSRGVCWSTNQSPTISDNKTSDGTGAGSFSSKLYDYQKLTTYYVRAYAINSKGLAYGNQVSYKTPCSLQSILMSLQSPSNESYGLSLNTNLEWQIIRQKYPIVFDVYMDNIPDPVSKIAANLSSGTFSPNGLTPGTRYYWKVEVLEPPSLCIILTSSVYSFTTSLTVKTPSVSTTPITSYTETSAIIGGKIPDDGGAGITEYGIYLGTTRNTELSGTKLYIGSGTGSFSKSITGLNPLTDYFVRAYATNSVGTAYGVVVSFDLSSGSETVTDIDGNIYNTVWIGSQLWMAENLKTSRYADGTTIPFVNTSDDWAALNETSKAYCWYDDNIINKEIYGALYTWGAAMNGSAGSNKVPSGVRGVCPTGWHLPSDAEWSILETFLGGWTIAGNKIKETGISHWAFPNPGATDESGFTGLPGGFRGYATNYNGKCSGITVRGEWWSSYELSGTPKQRTLTVGSSYIFPFGNSRNWGLSVRCVRD
jgi:uncharacterized protein (TIGR02145 family)